MSIVTGMTIFVLVLNFTSCKVLKQNESTATTNNSNKPLIVFFNCSIQHDSISQEYKIDLVNKIITEGIIKNTTVNSKSYEKGDFKYCLLNKNNQIISFSYMQNPLNKTIEYVDENGHMGKKSIRLDSTQFSLRVQLTADSKYVRFEKDNKQILLVDLNIE